MENWFKNIELEDSKVRLIPLDKSHKDELLDSATDGKLWELWFTSVPSAENINTYIADALKQKQDGKGFPFVVIDRKSGKVIGSTRYCNATPEHRRLEIGYTWYAKRYQQTGVNTACKYLLLKHAFEELDCIAVEFLTNWYNLRSRAAIARLGAKQDGVLRNHRLNADGSFRDSVVFSIIKQEWPGVKKLLTFEMGKYPKDEPLK